MTYVNRRQPIRDPRLRRLRWTLANLAPRPELLLDLMGFGHFAEMAMTRDGLLIGRLHGQDGFDAFLGSITEAMRDRTRRLWLELSRDQRVLVLDRLGQLEIPPDRVGIDLDLAKAIQPQLLTQEVTR